MEVRAVEDEAEAAATVRHVNEHLVSVAAPAQLDPGALHESGHVLERAGLDRPARGVELDRRLVALDRHDLDLSGRDAQIDRHRTGRVEGLASHRPDLTTGFRRARFGSRVSTRISMWPKGAG